MQKQWDLIIKNAERILEYKARIICFVVYGQQPSASSQNMEGAVETSKKLKQLSPDIFTLFVGGHLAALPEETLKAEDSIDAVCQNEGVYSIGDFTNRKVRRLLFVKS